MAGIGIGIGMVNALMPVTILNPLPKGTSTPEVGAPQQRLHSALAGCNPLYRISPNLSIVQSTQYR